MARPEWVSARRLLPGAVGVLGGLLGAVAGGAAGVVVGVETTPATGNAPTRT